MHAAFSHFMRATTFVCCAAILPMALHAQSVNQNASPSHMSSKITSDGQLVGPGRGLTAQFEVQFMKLTIDHHFAALRATELAAGTDAQRDAALSPSEGTSPTPGFSSTPAKADLDDLRSLARRNNRMQREEIMALQSFLRDWYGINYQPKISSSAQAMLDLLESAQAGKDFDHKFLEVFSRHHFTLMDPVNHCLSGAELLHPDLHRLCQDMWHSQTSDIDQMRRELARHFGIVDYQPFKDPRGQHSGAVAH